jgi:hypothetical protein
MDEKDKIILTGRIYPAIQSCVRNRYLIVLGIFAYYSFVFTSERFDNLCENQRFKINVLVSLIFSFFVAHNLANYWLNQKDEVKIERGETYEWKDFKKYPCMEIVFSLIVLCLIWGSQYLFFTGETYWRFAGIGIVIWLLFFIYGLSYKSD